MRQPDDEMRRRPDKPQPETDPRFPSGPWVGFWIQRGFGKQRMSLWLGSPRAASPAAGAT